MQTGSGSISTWRQRPDNWNSNLETTGNYVINNFTFGVFCVNYEYNRAAVKGRNRIRPLTVQARAEVSAIRADVQGCTVLEVCEL